MLDVENPGNETLPVFLIITEQVPSLLICVSRNKIGLRFEKWICVLGIVLCFGKLNICVNLVN